MVPGSFRMRDSVIPLSKSNLRQIEQPVRDCVHVFKDASLECADRLCTKSVFPDGYLSRKGAKTQSAAAFSEVFFASLRLCARNILATHAPCVFLCKAAADL